MPQDPCCLNIFHINSNVKKKKIPLKNG